LNQNHAMSALRWLSALMFALAVVAGAALLLQRQAAAQLRDEIALLRDENRELGRLRAEHQRLVAAQPTAAQLDAIRADHAAVVRLRSEIEALKARTDETARAVEQATLPLIAASQWKNAGRATPAAAVETMLWAASRRDLDTMASMIGFDAQLRPSVDQFFAAIPESVRAQHGTVERLVAQSLMKNLPLVAMRITAEGQSGAAASLTVRLQSQDGSTKDLWVSMQRGDAGWWLAVPARTVQTIANEIGSQMQVAPKGD
jgi:hypothetical protein